MVDIRVPTPAETPLISPHFTYGKTEAQRWEINRKESYTVNSGASLEPDIRITMRRTHMIKPWMKGQCIFYCRKKYWHLSTLVLF